MVESNMSHAELCMREHVLLDERAASINHITIQVSIPAYRFYGKKHCRLHRREKKSKRLYSYRPDSTYIIRGWSKPDGRIIVDSIGATRETVLIPRKPLLRSRMRSIERHRSTLVKRGAAACSWIETQARCSYAYNAEGVVRKCC